MTTLIEDLQSICADIFARWDADMKAGKLLSALEGRITNYDPRVTRVREALIQHEPRITDLLEANGRYLDRARKAESERDEARAAVLPFACLKGPPDSEDVPGDAHFFVDALTGATITFGMIRRARAAAKGGGDGAHTDDQAVDRFALAMKAKLAAARAKGRGGWDDPAQCTIEVLERLFAEHVGKGNSGNWVDLANLAMMIHERRAAAKGGRDDKA